MKKKKTMKKIEDIVCVLWLDAHSQDDWTDEKNALEFAEKTFKNSNRTYGEILKETKNYILIAASHTEPKDLYGDLMMIPKKMIRQIKLLKRKLK